MVTLTPTVLDLPYDLGALFYFYSGNKMLASHAYGKLTIYPGYASDGYSPVMKRPWFIPGSDQWLRITPIPSCGLAPALGHDCVRQFLNTIGCPWNRQFTDDCFYNWLEQGGVSGAIAGAYHEAVAGITGSIWIWATSTPDPNLHIVKNFYTS